MIEVVGEQLDRKGEVKLDSIFVDDLDADSLDTIELIIALEEEFKVGGGGVEGGRERGRETTRGLSDTHYFRFYEVDVMKNLFRDRRREVRGRT